MANEKNGGVMVEAGEVLKFNDRHEAGRFLARELVKYKHADPIVFGLPRGGVPVAYEIAKSLHAPMDTIIAQKLGLPSNPEYGIGAMAPGGILFLNQDPGSLGLSAEELQTLLVEEHIELERRIKEYGSGTYAKKNSCGVAILADDGLATGVTARAAIMAVKKMYNPRKIVLAIPVCPPETAAELAGEVNEFVCLSMPPDFWAVSQWYREFEQLMDEEVVGYLERASEELKLKGDRRT